MSKKKKEDIEDEIQEECGCGGDCDCGDDCDCGGKEEQSEELTLSEQVEALAQQLEIAAVVVKREKQKTEEVIKLNDRMKAEFDNYRTRTADSVKKAETDGAVKVIEKILPVLDSFDSAEAMISDAKTREGIAIIKRQLNTLLNGYGVEEIAALGEEFDPNFHNCVQQVKAKRPEDKGKVVQILQKGYKIGERIIRHSVVYVAD